MKTELALDADVWSGSGERQTWDRLKPFLTVLNRHHLSAGSTDRDFGALFVLILASCSYSCFEVVFYLHSEPLGVDFGLPNRPSDLQNLDFLQTF